MCYLVDHKLNDSASEDPEYPLEHLRRLLEISLAFEEVGVKYVWISEPSFKDTPFGKPLCDWEG